MEEFIIPQSEICQRRPALAPRKAPAPTKTPLPLFPGPPSLHSLLSDPRVLAAPSVVQVPAEPALGAKAESCPFPPPRPAELESAFSQDPKRSTRTEKFESTARGSSRTASLELSACKPSYGTAGEGGSHHCCHLPLPARVFCILPERRQKTFRDNRPGVRGQVGSSFLSTQLKGGKTRERSHPQNNPNMSALRTQLGKVLGHALVKSRGDMNRCKGVLFVFPKGLASEDPE